MPNHPTTPRKWRLPALAALSFVAGWTALRTDASVTETLGAFTPHGFCLSWKPELIWVHAGSNLLIALAYFVIPGAIFIFWLPSHPRPHCQPPA
jgi:hypothetical protein